MISIFDALEALHHIDELQLQIANLTRENAELRQRLTGETMRANQAEAKADFYYTLHTESQTRKERN